MNQTPFPALPVYEANGKGRWLNVSRAVIIIALWLTDDDHPVFSATQVCATLRERAGDYPRAKNISTLTERGVLIALETYRRQHTRVLARMGQSGEFAWISRPSEGEK
jgi:hypothetical protein